MYHHAFHTTATNHIVNGNGMYFLFNKYYKKDNQIEKIRLNAKKMKNSVKRMWKKDRANRQKSQKTESIFCADAICTAISQL